MRVLNVLSALLVTLCAVYLSIHHTHDLYMSVGFSSKQAWVAVIMSETMFIMGGLNVAVARFRNYKPGVPAYIGFLQGLLLVGWSNIASTAKYGIAGWLLGGSIVSAVLVMEAIMTYLATSKKTGRKADSNDQPPTKRTNRTYHTDQPDNQPATNQPEYTDRTYQPEQPEETAYQPEQPAGTAYQPEQPEGTDQPTEEPTAPTVTTTPTNQSNRKRPDYQDYQPVGKQPVGIAQPVGNDDHTNRTNQTDQAAYHSDQPEGTVQTYQPEDAPTNQPDYQPADNDQSGATDHIDQSDQPEDTYQKALETAIRIYDEEGKPPGRLRLARAAGCSDWHARQVLKELKKRIS